MAFRIALCGKGLLLVGIAGIFGALAWRIGMDPGRGWALRAAVGLAGGATAVLLAWVARLAFADAMVGEAVRAVGAVALASRRAGHSLRLPDGHFAEFILYNSWSPLVPQRRYTVTYGRFSRVLVAPPEPEAAATTSKA